MKIDIKKYAEFQGVTKRAINKRIEKNKALAMPLHSGLPYVQAVEKIGNKYILYVRNELFS